MMLLTHHRSLLTNLLGLAGVVLLVALVAHRLVRRAGGWARLRRRIARELTLTAAALAEPVRRLVTYQRRLRTLTRLLGEPRTWLAAERALAAAAAFLDQAVPGTARPYAVLAGRDRVGVLIVGRDVPVPPPPWWPDPDDPRLWWRSTVDDRLPQGQAVLVALGVQGTDAVLLDLATGPAATAVDGGTRATTALVQAIAAQLDDRLPAGSVRISAGVHPRYPGPSPDDTLRSAAEHGDHAGPVFAICGHAPANWYDGGVARLVVRGTGRGHVRLLMVDQDGLLTVHGTPLRPDVTVLPQAVSRSIGALPAWPAPAAGAAGPDRRGGDDLDERPLADTGVSATGSASRPGGDPDSRSGSGPASRSGTGGDAA